MSQIGGFIAQMNAALAGGFPYPFVCALDA